MQHDPNQKSDFCFPSQQADSEIQMEIQMEKA